MSQTGDTSASRSGDSFRVHADDPEYVRQARAEAEFWGRPHEFGCEVTDVDADGPFERYANRKFTGNDTTRWFDLIPGYGPFRRALVVGASGMAQEARIVEMNPDAHVTFCDISAEALARRERDFGARFPDRIATRVLDLNFAEFEPDAFDLIVSSSTLHHVLNLEHVAHQLNRALTPDGYLFVQDYVGEAGYRFPAEKKRIVDALYHREGARRGVALPGCDWSDVDNGDYSPFEAVRSDEILDILRRYLVEGQLRTMGAVAGTTICARPRPFRVHGGALHRARLRLRSFAERGRKRLTGREPPLMSEEAAAELILIDELVTDTGLLRPLNAFGIYRKRSDGS